MKNISYFFITLSILLLYSCSPMDNKYSEFVKDGPITYLSKLKETEIKIIGERNRVHFIWPQQSDPRGTKAEIYWSNKMGRHIETIDPSKETNFYISDLAEGSYIFEIRILDDEGHFSIHVSMTATVYGTLWESYLANRNIMENVQEGDDRKITYRENVDKTILGTEFEWKQDGITHTIYIDSAQVTGYLGNFKASSFRYRTKYIPEEGGIDVFYSSWQYFVDNITKADIDAGFDKLTNTYTLPTLNDGNWAGYEFRWTDITTGEARNHSVTGSVATLTGYNALAVNIITLFVFDDVPISTMPIEYGTVRYMDLDRSDWYIAPETRVADGSEIRMGENNADFNTTALIVKKVKSPYISHWIPGGSNGSADANNVPGALYDGNNETFLSICKGPGPGATTAHSVGGVGPLRAGEEIYVILDLGSRQPFNYFRLVYRPGQSSQTLKPQKISFYGSNDADPLSATWHEIQKEIAPPGSGDPSNNANLNHIGRISGNVILPESNYRYIKMTYDEWTDSSNSMQLSELYLGYYY